ncbi:MAG: ABC transporter permease [Terrimicrobiaceae bacterium]|nr:ABC transporter permease [Terrimicrobiaceae bacterium]
MNPIATIIKRELAGYFGSPIAYVFIVIFLVLAGFFTFMVGGFLPRGEADLQVFFFWLPWLYLFLVPAVGMRMWSEERRMGTLELLLTLPVAPGQAILAKFLAAWIVIAAALALTFPIPLTAHYLGDTDNGVIIAGYLGALLLAGAYLAVTSATSALTRNQVISFIISLTLCLFLVLAGWPPVTDLFMQWAGPGLVDVVAGFSVMTHFEAIQRGILDLRDALYFVSVIVFGLLATGVILHSHRSG